MQLWEYFEDLQPQVENWIKLLLLPGPNGTIPMVSPPQAPVGIYWWTLITFGCVGLYVFVIFGLLSKRVRTAWFTAVKNIMNGRKYSYDPDNDFSFPWIEMGFSTMIQEC